MNPISAFDRHTIKQKEAITYLLASNDLQDRVAAFQKRFELLKRCKSDTAQEVRKIERQTELFVDLIHRRNDMLQLQKSGKIGGNLVSDLYLGQGVCIGACIDLAAQKIKDPTKELTIQPNTQARFLEAAHILRKRLYVHEKVYLSRAVRMILFSRKEQPFFAVCYYLYSLFLHIWEWVWGIKSVAFSDALLLQLANNPVLDEGFLKAREIKLIFARQESLSITAFLETFNPASYECAKSAHFILTVSGHTKNAEAAQELLKSLKNSKLAQNFYAELKRVGSVAQINKAALIKERVLERVGKDAPQPILDKIAKKISEELDCLINDLEGRGNRFKKNQGGHAVYLHLAPPYEIQDVNFPGCTLFKTDDVEEFKLFLLFWFTITGYKRVNHLQQVMLLRQ